MKNIVLLILLGGFLSNCSNGDADKIDCELFDPGFPSLYIKLIDSNGTNLIEEGTFNADEIELQNGLGFRYHPPNELANPDAAIRSFDHTLELVIPNESTFQYLIKLNDTAMISIDFSAKLTKIPCGITYYVPTGIVYDNQNLELIEVSPLQFLTDIEL